VRATETLCGKPLPKAYLRRFGFCGSAGRYHLPRANDNVKQNLRDAFAELPPQVLEIIILHYEHGFSDADIAAFLARSRSTIASTLSRARARLQKALGNRTDPSAEREIHHET